MATLKASPSLFSTTFHQSIMKASSINQTKLSLIPSGQTGIKISCVQSQKLPVQITDFSVASLQVNDLVDELKRQNRSEEMLTSSTQKHKFIKNMRKQAAGTNSSVVEEMYAIVEAVADRVEMHKNIGEQRNNWNHLLLTSVNGMITTAATIAGLGAMNGLGESSLLALKLSSTLLYVAATGILMIMNKIQPSQLAEEQRNASRLFKQLLEELKTGIALGKVTSQEVENAMEKVLALDKAYPLPLLGVMLDKFPKRVEPAVWWPKHLESNHGRPASMAAENGWNDKLEEEMKRVLGVIRKRDEEDYVRLAKIALNLNKILAISGPLLTGLAAAGSAFLGLSAFGSWPMLLAVVCGALATVVNTIEHGGQVGMVFEMYRSSAGFFRFMEESIESALEDGEGGRESGEVFEAKVALELGRSLSELRELAKSSSSSSRDPNSKEEFASKLF